MKNLGRSVSNKKNRRRGGGRRCTLSSCRDGEEASDRGEFLNALVAEWNDSLANGQGLAVGYEYVGRVRRRLEEERCWQRPDFEGDSFTLTSDGKGDRFDTRVLRGLKRAFVPAFAGLAVGLVLLGLYFSYPKVVDFFTPQGRVEPPQISGGETPGGSTTGQEGGEPGAGAPSETSVVIADPPKTAAPVTDDGASEGSAVGREGSGATVATAPVGEVDTALTAGRSALDRGEYKVALEKAEFVLTKLPDDPRALDIASGAKTGLADALVKEGNRLLETQSGEDAVEALKKSSEAQDYVSGHAGARDLRTRSTSAALSAAQTAYKLGEYGVAKRLAQGVLDVVKTDGYATTILTDAQAGLDKKNQIAAALTAGRKLLDEGKLDAALAEVLKALELDANHGAALALKGEIENAITDGKVATLVDDGWRALNQKDYATALEKAEEALKLRPSHSGALNLKSETTTRRVAAEKAQLAAEVAKLVQEGRDALKNGYLTLAKSKANKALEKDPGNAEAKALLADVENAETAAKKAQLAAEVAKLVQEGRDALKKGDFSLAKSKANAAIGKESGNKEAQTLLSDAEKAETAAKQAAQSTSGGVWAESKTRRAGFRQELEIKGMKYGFCWIPAGEFDMGSPTSEKNRDNDETLHHVKLTKGYWMLETEVPQKLYEAVMGTNPSEFKGADLPVETVSWNESVAFCNELTKLLPKGVKAKLPTEAQWEMACRTGTKTPYWYGNTAYSNKMNYNDSKIGKTTPVKSYAPNAWELYDMHGNVWEWCADYYGDYPTGTVVDPTGPQNASYRVNRGGGWHYYAGSCRSASRRGRESDFRYYDLGFRVLLVCD